MARIRSIKPKAFKSEDITCFPRAMRWTVAGLWTYCDDEGRGNADPRLIKAEIYALDDDVTPEVLAAELDLMEREGHICRYAIGRRTYLHVVKFKEHQHPNRPVPSELPECPHPQHPMPKPEPEFTHGVSSESAVSTHGGHTAVVVVGGEVERERDTPTALALRAEQAPLIPASESEGQRVNRLAKTYTDRVPMSRFPAVAGIVRSAVRAGKADEDITPALERLAREGRPLTVDVLRVEMEGLPPRAGGSARKQEGDRILRADMEAALAAERNAS